MIAGYAVGVDAVEYSLATATALVVVVVTYATIVVGSVFSASFFLVISWIERRVLTWDVGRT